GPPAASTRSMAPAPEDVPLGRLPLPVREDVRAVLEKPTLAARGPGEQFACRPEQYYWFLDHPDRAVLAWRRLGAKCVGIQDQGNGVFGFTDETGTINWQTVYRDGDKRVWYAWGKVKPTPLLPSVPVRAVVVLHHSEHHAGDGGTQIHHYCDLYIHT